MKRDTEASLIDRFDKVGNAPEFWRRRAKELLSSSDALLDLWNAAIECDPPRPRDALDYDRPAIMLRAMAAECLLKALAVERGMILARGGRYVRIPGVRNHDLLGLAKVLGFDLSAHEVAVLRHLSRFITAGRYPMQQVWSEQTKLRPDGLVEMLCVGWNPYWDDTWESVLALLRPSRQAA